MRLYTPPHLVSFLALTACVFASAIVRANEFPLYRFERIQLTDTYFSEGASSGDIDGDSIHDAIYGPYWFKGPKFTQGFEIYKPEPQPTEGYANSFFTWVYDFNRDGHNDLLAVGFPGTPAFVYENPGQFKEAAHWAKHQVFDWVSNESPQFIDIVGDEHPELVCTRDGFFGFAVFNPERPFDAWAFHAVSEQTADRKFGHGLGVGDVNGDGWMDIIHSGGWYEQPMAGALEGRWISRTSTFTDAYGGADMHAYDIDGDGDNDVITSLAAHHFGLAWFENKTTDNGEVTFEKHIIVGDHASQNRYGIVFSEPHAVALVDMDGDGLKDIVTGKTYYSHHKGSPMWDAGAVAYWFKLVRSDAVIDFVPHLISDQTGVGRGLTVTDVDQDGMPDVVVGGMKGASVLLQRNTLVDEATWLAAQPKLVTVPAPAATVKPEVIAKAARKRGPDSPIDEASNRVDKAIEGESIAAKITAGTASPQGMQGFAADRWSNDQQLWWTGAKPGDRITLPLPVKDACDRIEVVLSCARDYAIVQLYLDDQLLGEPIDCFNAEVTTTGVLTYEVKDWGAKSHSLAIEILGANPSAVKAYMVGVDYVRLAAPNEKFATPTRLKSRTVTSASAVPLPADEYPHRGLDAESAAAAMKVPDGFTVTVSAAEPDVKQPIAMTIDDRGRVWIAEAYEYPIRAKEGAGRDRILIFEDVDGDGKFDKRKVFAEGLNLVSGLEVGYGGVWVGAAPYLLYIADANGDDVPDSAPEVLLDGWGQQDTHETLNAFNWGPDGWLYGCHGVFTHSHVGKPGTPDDQRTPINAGVWRYHPLRHEFEVFAHGTSNPWGVDFNDHGQAFVTACVIPHLFHMIQGARYQRQAGQHFNPHTYQDIVTIADHLHYLGANPHAGNGRSDEMGGGHAHAGAMIYLASTWPEQYRNSIFMNNIHGQRLNVDVLTAKGSGYVGSHAPDFLLTGDQASQILNLRTGPDGNAYMIDWYDMQACHTGDVGKHDRSNGRIYKVSFGKQVSKAVALRPMSDMQLAEQVLETNDFFVRQARNLLAHRASTRPIDSDARKRLVTIARSHQDDTRRLRAMWALHVSGGVPAGLHDELMLRDPSGYVRGWAVQLAMETSTEEMIETKYAKRFARMSTDDDSPVVRMYLASAAQRMPASAKWDIIDGLARHASDANDHNLPLMIWYAAEPLADIDAKRALAMALSTGEQMPLLRDFMLRRIGSRDLDDSILLLVEGLQAAKSDSLQLVFLNALRTSLKGQRQAKSPAKWAQVYSAISKSESREVQQSATALHALFGDSEALNRLRSDLVSQTSALPLRRDALATLIQTKDPQLPEVLYALLQSPELRIEALRGLAQYDNPETAKAIIDRFSSMNAEEKATAMATLCSRTPYAKEMLVAVQEMRIAKSDLSADLVRQLSYLESDDVNEQIATVWGRVRQTAADKAEQIAAYTKMLTSPPAIEPDSALGRAVFAKTCQRCHVLYGVGQALGPDLTGANRSNLDYLLTNIVDPSAVMANEYQQTLVLTDNGQVITGIVRGEDERNLTLQTADTTLVIPKDEIEQRRASEKSMMPDDQLKQFSEHEVRSLIAYLMGKEQAPETIQPK